MTTAGAVYLTIILLLSLYTRIISSFLIVFSFMVILAAYSLIPGFAWSSLQLLGVMVLWIELAQIEKKRNYNRPVSSLSRDEQLKRLSWAGGGIVCGGLISFVWGLSFILSVTGAFVGNVLLSLVENESFPGALRRALLIVEEEPAGSVIKSGFCLILFISLLLSSIG